jgi:hypothetical protein
MVLAWLHVPPPEQNDGGWNVVTLHEIGAPHTVDAAACWQAPLTHTPVLPHGGLAAQLGGSAVPLATFAHVPTPLTLHDWQPAQPLVVQQTPSMQKPVPHSLPPMQGAPAIFLATQLPGVDALPVQ